MSPGRLGTDSGPINTYSPNSVPRGIPVDSQTLTPFAISLIIFTLFNHHDRSEHGLATWPNWGKLVNSRTWTSIPKTAERTRDSLQQDPQHTHPRRRRRQHVSCRTQQATGGARPKSPIVARANPIPTGSLTVEKLSRNQKNYTSWWKTVEPFLADCSSLNLYLDGTIPKPADTNQWLTSIGRSTIARLSALSINGSTLKNRHSWVTLSSD